MKMKTFYNTKLKMSKKGKLNKVNMKMRKMIKMKKQNKIIFTAINKIYHKTMINTFIKSSLIPNNRKNKNKNLINNQVNNYEFDKFYSYQFYILSF